MKITFLLAILFPVALCAQEAQLFKQHNMKRWGVPAGNYSGITPIGGDGFALISDKQEWDGQKPRHPSEHRATLNR